MAWNSTGIRSSTSMSPGAFYLPNSPTTAAALSASPISKLVALEFKQNFYLFGDRDVDSLKKPNYYQTRMIHYIENNLIRNGESPVKFSLKPWGLEAQHLAGFSGPGITFKRKLFDFSEYGTTWFLEQQ